MKRASKQYFPGVITQTVGLWCDSMSLLRLLVPSIQWETLVPSIQWETWGGLSPENSL